MIVSHELRYRLIRALPLIFAVAATPAYGRFVEQVEVIHEIHGEAAGAGFGIGNGDAGDVNGDGVIDLLITSAWSGVKGEKSGRIWVLSSAPAETTAKEGGAR